MGSGSHDPVDHASAVKALDDSGKAFARSTRAAATGDFAGSIAKILDPKGLKNGVRESCFAPGFDQVTPIVVSIDCTASMEDVPEKIQKALPALIGLLVEQGITDHPNVMFIGHDDETVVPNAAFQMSQFEIGAPKLVEALNEMVIPMRGGGNDGEAYHLTFYALARHTKLESFERDGTKGFAFVICDEQPYYDAGDPSKHGTSPAIAHSVFGDRIEAEVTMLESVRETCKKFNVFVLRPKHTHHGTDVRITKMWQKLLQDAGENPEHVLEVAETDALVSTMAMAIGRFSGVEHDDLVDVLRAKGAKGVHAASKATAALVPAVGAALVAQASGEITTSSTGAHGRARR